MQREKLKVNYRKSTKKGFDSASLLFSVIAVVLIVVGIYLNFQSKSAIGISQPGRYGQGGGSVLNIPGLFVIALGVFFSFFPLIDLIRYLKARSK